MVKEQQQRSDSLTNENEERGACSRLWKMFVGQHRIQKGRLVFRPLMRYWACLDGQHKKQLKQICFVINKSLEIKEHAAVPYTALHKEFQHKQNFSCSTWSCSNHVVVPQQMLFPVVNVCLIGTFVCFLSHKGSPQQMDPHILFGNILRQLPSPQSPS